MENAVGVRNIDERSPRGSHLGLIQPKQLRQLHALWREWAGKLELPSEKRRALRHYYVWLLSNGRASETVALTAIDAQRVISSLAKLARMQPSAVRSRYVAGTAGRHGFPERRRVAPSRLAWNAFWQCASSLGMDRAGLDRFIQRHYIKAGLRSVVDIQTMADLNRVLWGLKAVLRRRSRKEPNSYLTNAA